MTARRWTHVRLGCTAASAAVLAVAVTVLGSLTPGYDQGSEAVSRLASPGEPWALAARVSFAVYGLLVLAGVSAVRHYAGRYGRTLAFCLTLYGLACVVAGVAAKDQPGTPHTTVSEVHVVACVMGGALAIIAMTLVAVCGPTRRARRSAVMMALLTILAAIIFKYTWGSHVYGISERAVLGLGMCWISALAASALTADLRACGRSDPRDPDKSADSPIPNSPARPCSMAYRTSSTRLCS